MRAFRFVGAGRSISICSFLPSLVVIAASIFCVVLSAHPNDALADAVSGPRIALLVANGTYPDANLPNPSAAKDADLFAGELTRYGFEVDVRKELTKADLQEAISTFLKKITPGSVALFYFNGIGIQVSHQTYLVPVNAELWSETDVKRDGIGVDTVLTEMNRRGASVKIAVIDAARRNPFERRFRAYSAGLAGIDAPEGTLVMYATAPNKIGKDAGNDVSLFMNELVKELRTPDISAEEAMTHTRVGVSRASNGEQVPWVASSLIEPFFFSKSSQSPAEPPAAVPMTPPPVSPPKEASPPAVPPKPPAKEAARQPATKLEPQPGPATPPKVPEKPEPVQKIPAAPSKPDATVASRATPTPIPTPKFGPPQDLKPGSVFKDCPDCPDMVVLPGGTFDMGSGKTPYDRPVHKVTFPRPFAIGETEVTFADWDRCVSEGGCKTRPDTQGWGGDDRPVINVSWYDASDYVAWLAKRVKKTYRLPSEAEWEYAAHGGTTTPFAWGSALGTGQANCMDCNGAGAGKQTMPVKSFKPNGYGLYDMAGNAAEWVQDCWTLTYKKAPTNGAAWTDGNCAQRDLRGGSFDSTSVYIKPSARFRYDADVKYWANGLRVVRELP